MALTKTQLKEILSAAGVSAENVDAAVEKIMDGHVTSINALREERDGFKAEANAYKADADKLKDVQKELDSLKAKGDPDWQKKYEDEHGAFEAYKIAVAGEKEKDEKISLYRSLLTECNVGKNQIDAVIRVTDIDKLAIKDGKLDNVEQLKAGIEKDWAAFIMKGGKRGVNVDNPPENVGGGKPEPESRAAKLAAEYHKNLYGETKGA